MKEKGPNILAGAILGASIALSSSVATAQDTVKNDVIRCTPTQLQTAEDMLAKRTQVVRDGKIFIIKMTFNNGVFVKHEIPYEEALASAQAELERQRKSTIEHVNRGNQTRFGAAATAVSFETGCI